MQLHTEQGGQFLPARFQRRGSGLQGFQVDHALHVHDLGPLQAPADLGQFLFHRRALALDHASVFLGGLLIARRRHGDRLRRNQMRFHAR